MTEVLLSEVAAINPRPRKRPADDELVSFLGMADVDQDRGSTSLGTSRPYADVAKGYTPFEDGDILVAKITPCFENGKIAQARLDNQLGMGSTEFHVIRPDPSQLDARYALHFLRGREVRRAGELRMTGSAGQRRVPEAFLRQLALPLVPIEEQRRIAEMLDGASIIREKRQRFSSLLDELVRSIFIDMFIQGSSRWPDVLVAELVDEDRGGIRTGPFGSQLLHSEFVEDGIAVLGIDNVVENRFTWGRFRFISESKYQRLRRYTVHPGDVLITIMGTCGRVAVVPDSIPTAINTKHLCCISLNQNECLPGFLHGYFMFHPDARSYLERTAKGAIMSGLNMGIIKSLPVKLPPIGKQREFTARVESIERLRSAHEAAAAKSGALLPSLQTAASRSGA